MTMQRPMFPPPRGEALPLSALFVDPVLADAFRRAERGPSAAFAVPAPCPHEAGAFDDNLRRLCAAANLAYGLARQLMLRRSPR